MRGLMIYWVVGCLLVGAAASDYLRECGRLPSLTSLMVIAAIWPAAVGAVLWSPKGFKPQTQCQP